MCVADEGVVADRRSDCSKGCNRRASGSKNASSGCQGRPSGGQRRASVLQLALKSQTGAIRRCTELAMAGRARYADEGAHSVDS